MTDANFFDVLAFCKWGPGAECFEDFSREKIERFLSHRIRTNSIAVVSEGRRVYGVATWHRIPDDLDAKDAMEWTWKEPATVGKRIFISSFVAISPLGLSGLWEAMKLCLPDWSEVTAVGYRRGKLVEYPDALQIKLNHGTAKT